MGASTKDASKHTSTDRTDPHRMPTSGLATDPASAAAQVNLVKNYVSVFEASLRPPGSDNSGAMPRASSHEQPPWQQPGVYSTLPRRSGSTRNFLRTDNDAHACSCSTHQHDQFPANDISRDLQPLLESIHTLTKQVIRIAQALEENAPAGIQSASGHSRTSSTLSEAASTTSERSKPNPPKAATTAAKPAFTFTAAPASSVSRPCRRTTKSTSTPPSKGAKTTSAPSPRNSLAAKSAIFNSNKHAPQSIPRRSSHHISPLTPTTPRLDQQPAKTLEKPVIRSPPPAKLKTPVALSTLSEMAPQQKPPQPAHLEQCRPIFGQVSTPPVRSKVELKVADSPFSNYCDENSPFALLRKRSGASLEER